MLLNGGAAESAIDRLAVSDSVVASLIPPADLPERGWTDRCESCHAAAVGFSHPVDVVPSMTVPAELPLLDGRITCITCHDNSSAALHRQARAEGTDLLRMPSSDGRLCSACHDAMSPRRGDRHALMLQRAHLRWPEDPERGGAAPSSDAPRAMFDPQSGTCLSCHDGSVAPDIGHETAGFAIGNGGALGFPGNHPIGVEYPRTAPDRKGPPLKDPSILDDRIRLYNDRVGCLTCHSPYSSQRGLLVLPNAGSALCLNCHDY
jgi:predicted CXXCH cytochrome family protein